MSELQHYYQNFCANYWAHPDAEICRCKGRGWVLSEVDTWHECPYHKGQPHPEDEGRECDPCDVIPAPEVEPAPSAPTPEDLFGDDDIPF